MLDIMNVNLQFLLRRRQRERERQRYRERERGRYRERQCLLCSYKIQFKEYTLLSGSIQEISEIVVGDFLLYQKMSQHLFVILAVCIRLYQVEVLMLVKSSMACQGLDTFPNIIWVKKFAIHLESGTEELWNICVSFVLSSSVISQISLDTGSALWQFYEGRSNILSPLLGKEICPFVPLKAYESCWDPSRRVEGPRYVSHDC